MKERGGAFAFISLWSLRFKHKKTIDAVTPACHCEQNAGRKSAQPSVQKTCLGKQGAKHPGRAAAPLRPLLPAAGAWYAR
jgi:hypothetical protein